MTKLVYPKAVGDKAERFTNAGGNIVARAFGTKPQVLTAQSGLAYVRWNGTNAGAINYIVGRVASATANGMRWFSNDNASQPTLAVGFDSTGTAGSPNVTNTTITHKLGQWYAIAYSHDGSLTAANIIMYTNNKGNVTSGGANTPLAAIANSTTSNGTTAFSNSSANNYWIGDREGGARNFVGDIAYFAQWNRVLSLNELEKARIYGPLTVTNGLVMLWADGKDWGPQHLVPIRASSTTWVQYPSYITLGPASRRYGTVPSLWPKIIGLVTTGTWKTTVGVSVASGIASDVGLTITSVKTSQGLTR